MFIDAVGGVEIMTSGSDCFSFISHLNVYVINILHTYITILKTIWYANHLHMRTHLKKILDLEKINDGS